MEIAADLRARVVALEMAKGATEQRLNGFEQWQRQMDIFNAVRDEQFKNMLDKFESINTKIDGVQSSLTGDIGELSDSLRWLTRLIIGTIVVSVITGAVGLLFKMVG